MDDDVDRTVTWVLVSRPTALTLRFRQSRCRSTASSSSRTATSSSTSAGGTAYWASTAAGRATCSRRSPTAAARPGARGRFSPARGGGAVGSHGARSGRRPHQAGGGAPAATRGVHARRGRTGGRAPAANLRAARGVGLAAFEARAAELLHGLGFKKDMMRRATKDMSGGWRMRVALARALRGARTFAAGRAHEPFGSSAVRGLEHHLSTQ